MGFEIEETLKWQKEVTGIKKYHDLGYKGKGITVLNHEITEHGKKALSIIKEIAPEATFIEAEVSQMTTSKKLYKYNWKINGNTYTFDEVMKKFKPDIISVSLAGADCEERDDLIRPYIERGEVVLCNSAGNDGPKYDYDSESGIRGMYRNIALMIGACYFHNSKDNIKIQPYSGRDEDVPNIDYVGFCWDWGGTSAACPFVVGQLALLMSRFGKMSQAEIKKYLQPHCKDLGDQGYDWIYGDGLIVLPDNLDEFEKDKKEEVQIEMNFHDVKSNRWSYDAIKWASDKGLITGFPDGSFRPSDSLTREQICVILKKFYELIQK
jgi:hypothetical protein